MKITAASVEAQRAYDRGLTLAYAFAHYAAEQEFRRALRADPDCAMAWWGIALVNGPHINFPAVPPERAAKAWEALSPRMNPYVDLPGKRLPGMRRKTTTKTGLDEA